MVGLRWLMTEHGFTATTIQVHRSESFYQIHQKNLDKHNFKLQRVFVSNEQEEGDHSQRTYTSYSQ